RSSGGYPVTASSGKRTRSAFARCASASTSTTREAFPSMSPTTLLIWASASLIGFRLLVENSTTPLRERRPAPAEEDRDGDEEDGEVDPSEEPRMQGVRERTDRRRDDEDGDQQQAKGRTPHTGQPVWPSSSTAGFAGPTSRATAVTPRASSRSRTGRTSSR